MGREIVYCCQCQRRILGDELDKGTAYQVGNKITCSSCALQVLETLPPKEKESLLAKMFRETKDRQSKHPGPPSARALPSSTPPAIRRPAAAPGAPKVGWMAGAAVGAIVAAIVLWLAVGGSREPAEPPKSGPSAPSSDEIRRQKAADAIRKAREYSKGLAAEIDTQVALWQDAVFAADGTSYLADARREHEAAKVRQRETVSKDLSDLEQRLAPLLDKQEFKAAQDALEKIRTKRAVPEWTVEITRRAKSIDESVSKELVKAMEAAAIAKRKGFEDEAAAIRDRVARWGIPKGLADFDQALAGVTLPRPLVDPDLVAYWPLDEGKGATTTDASGKLTGRLEGATWTAGKFGSALRFDGVNAFMEMPSTPDLDKIQRGTYTVAAWVNPESRPTQGGEPYGFVVKAGYHMGLCMNHYGRFYSSLWFLENNNGRYQQLDSGNVFEPGHFYHVAGVVDAAAGVSRIYINGALEGESRWTPKTPTVEYGNSPWRLGCTLPGAKEYRQAAKAVIDEVRLYSRALSAAEVELLSRARLAAAK